MTHNRRMVFKFEKEVQTTEAPKHKQKSENGCSSTRLYLPLSMNVHVNRDYRAIASQDSQWHLSTKAIQTNTSH